MNHDIFFHKNFMNHFILLEMFDLKTSIRICFVCLFRFLFYSLIFTLILFDFVYVMVEHKLFRKATFFYTCAALDSQYAGFR